MLAVVGGGAVTAGALQDRPPVPVAVGDGVSVAPPLAWEFAARLDPAPGIESGILLTRGNGSLLVYTAGGSARQELDDVRAELASGTLVSTGESEPVDLRAGQEALRFAYSGALPELAAYPIEGEAIAVQGADVAAVFFAWAAVGDYQLVRAEIEQMIRQATIP